VQEDDQLSQRTLKCIDEEARSGISAHVHKSILQKLDQVEEYKKQKTFALNCLQASDEFWSHLSSFEREQEQSNAGLALKKLSHLFLAQRYQVDFDPMENVGERIPLLGSDDDGIAKQLSAISEITAVLGLSLQKFSDVQSEVSRPC